MDTALPELRTLALLDAIDRLGSVTLAAAEAGITQQAASGRLRRLEERLGRALVARGARSSALTDDGRAVLRLARPLLAAGERFDDAVAAYLDEQHALAVAASLTIAEHFLPRWIVALGEELGHAVPVEVRASNTREAARAVRAGEAELGFVEGDAEPQGLRSAPLALDELLVLVDPRHPWAREGRVGPWTLAAMPLVTREDGSGCRAVVVRALREHGVEEAEIAAPAMQLPSNLAVLEASAAGAGPVAISARAAEPYVRARRLVPVTVSGMRFRRQLRAVWRGGTLPASTAARGLLRAAERLAPMQAREA